METKIEQLMKEKQKYENAYQKHYKHVSKAESSLQITRKYMIERISAQLKFIEKGGLYQC